MASIDIDLHPKQGLVLQSEANEILFGGAAGGGKSHLIRILSIIFSTAVPLLQVYLFRKHYADLYKNHMEGPSSLPELLAPFYKDGLVKYVLGKNKIVMWNGATVHLCHLQHEKDLLKYQGAEIHVLIIDEVTHFTDKEYRFLRNRLRLGGLNIPKEVPSYVRLPLILACTNPGGPGHAWVKRTWIDYAPPMEINRTRKEEGGMLRQYIPSLNTDNPTLLKNDPGYIERLEGLGTPELVKAMKDGDWNIVAGGALDDVWSNLLIIPKFKIPANWKVDRSFDWGSSHPFSVGWWAESNGEEVMVKYKRLEGEYLIEDTKMVCFPAGTIIRINEWYGAKEIGSNEGLKMSSTDIAKGIAQREAQMVESGFIQSIPKPGPADNQIRNVTEGDQPTIADKMEKQGIKWKPSDKSPGSRVNGLELLRDRMTSSVKGEGPGIYFMSHCRAAISLLPILPRSDNNIEDVDTKAEDHVYDEVRYRVLASQLNKPGNVNVRRPT